MQSVASLHCTTTTTIKNNSNDNHKQNNDARLFEVIPLSACSISFGKVRRQSNSTWLEWPCRRKSQNSVPYTVPVIPDDDNENLDKTISNNLDNRDTTFSAAPSPSSIRERRRNRRTPRFNSVSKIDRASRVFFPFVFFLINLFYWYSYLTKSERWAKASITRQ